MRLNLGVFVLHAVQLAMWVAVPAMLVQAVADTSAAGSGLRTLAIDWDPAVTTADSSQVVLDFAGMTQLGETFEVAQVRGNGAGVGRLASVALDNSGYLNMSFTNGIQRLVTDEFVLLVAQTLDIDDGVIVGDDDGQQTDMALTEFALPVQDLDRG